MIICFVYNVKLFQNNEEFIEVIEIIEIIEVIEVIHHFDK
jgi:hypothetical protein